MKNRRYRELFFRLTSFIPFFLAGYDRFYLVRCGTIDRNRILMMKNGPQLKVADYSPEAVREIKSDLAGLDSGIIEFQMTGRSGDAKIIKIDNNGHCVAVCFAVKATSIRSPSGYSRSLKNVCPVTWVFGTYIDENFRLRGYFPHLVNAAFEVSRQNGSRGLMGEIHHLNVASIKSHAKMGFTVFRDVQYLKIAQWKYFWERTGDFWCLPKKV